MKIKAVNPSCSCVIYDVLAQFGTPAEPVKQDPPSITNMCVRTALIKERGVNNVQGAHGELGHLPAENIGHKNNNWSPFNKPLVHQHHVRNKLGAKPHCAVYITLGQGLRPKCKKGGLFISHILFGSAGACWGTFRCMVDIVIYVQLSNFNGAGMWFI